jgi:hypothetical protein
MSTVSSSDFTLSSRPVGAVATADKASPFGLRQPQPSPPPKNSWTTALTVGRRNSTSPAIIALISLILLLLSLSGHGSILSLVAFHSQLLTMTSLLTTLRTVIALSFFTPPLRPDEVRKTVAVPPNHESDGKLPKTKLNGSVNYLLCRRT